ncbi:hypothetical protein MLD52_09585 [Puniceicoccaceae bacterium K14]|nr:hypothetical protein [Puniceicoccaceae bacterium K14]
MDEKLINIDRYSSDARDCFNALRSEMKRARLNSTRGLEILVPQSEYSVEKKNCRDLRIKLARIFKAIDRVEKPDSYAILAYKDAVNEVFREELENSKTGEFSDELKSLMPDISDQW